jgi:Phage portal protein
MGLFGLFGRNINVERDRTGVFTYSFLENDGFVNSTKYLDLSLTNPVLMSIIALRCKIYSQMKITHLNSAGNPIENSEILRLLKQPNYFQSQEDFLFQQMWFLSATGTNYTYKVNALNTTKSIYNLLPSEIDLQNSQKVKSFITTKQELNAYGDRKIKYKLDGQIFEIALKNIIPTYDLANGLSCNSLMNSPSRVSGISKTLENIEENLLSKNVNLKMSQKYLMASQGDGNEAQIQQSDRNDITSKISRKSLLITNANIKAQHLVSDMKRLFLDEQFSNDALTCLIAFDMSKDILNYFSNGASTYENKEKAMLDYIQNSIQSDANNTMNSFASSFGLIDKGESLKASFEHMPVMQSVMKTKIETLKLYQETLIGYSEAEQRKLSEEFKLTLGL